MPHEDLSTDPCGAEQLRWVGGILKGGIVWAISSLDIDEQALLGIFHALGNKDLMRNSYLFELIRTSWNQCRDESVEGSASSLRLYLMGSRC